MLGSRENTMDTKTQRVLQSVNSLINQRDWLSLFKSIQHNGSITEIMEVIKLLTNKGMYIHSTQINQLFLLNIQCS